ncbi:MAG: 2-isopropylmalate synthase, partial [Planctomycetota bacterium]
NIFDTKKLLNRPIGVSVTDKSGVAGIAQWLSIFFGLKGNDQVPKNHEGVIKIKEWVDKQYNEGRIISISDDEMVEQARLHLRDFIKSDKLKM